MLSVLGEEGGDRTEEKPPLFFPYINPTEIQLLQLKALRKLKKKKKSRTIVTNETKRRRKAMARNMG